MWNVNYLLKTLFHLPDRTVTDVFHESPSDCGLLWLRHAVCKQTVLHGAAGEVVHFDNW